MHRDASLQGNPAIGTPLTVLVFELVLACAAAPRIITNVAINRNYAVITRGEAELAPGPFDLASCYGHRAASLLDKTR